MDHATHGRKRVFLSHSSRDRSDAQAIADGLESRGVGVWLATRQIASGESYAAAIAKGIAETSEFVVLISESALESPHVPREMNLAIEERKAIHPITLSSEFLDPRSLPDEWRYWLGTVQVSVLADLGPSLDGLARLLAPERTEGPEQIETVAFKNRPDARTGGSHRVGVESTQAIRSLLIHAGLQGLTYAEVCSRARRLHISEESVESAVLSLSEAHLISFEGELANDTTIRLN